MAILETFPSRDNSHTILNDSGTAVLDRKEMQFKGLSVTDNSTDEVTEVEASGLNTDSMDDVCAGAIGTNFITPSTNYSTNEQIVGKWIDGKPLYQKTCEFTTASSAGWANIDTATSHSTWKLSFTIFVCVLGTDGSFVGGNNVYGLLVDTPSTLSGNTSFRIHVNASHLYNKKGYITVQYTKTTDT